MIEGAPHSQPVESPTPADAESERDPKRALTTAEFLLGVDIPNSVRDLGFEHGQRSWMADAWDNLILRLHKREIVNMRQAAHTEWMGHFTPDKMANRFRIPTEQRTANRVG